MPRRRRTAWRRAKPWSRTTWPWRRRRPRRRSEPRALSWPLSWRHESGRLDTSWLRLETARRRTHELRRRRMVLGHIPRPWHELMMVPGRRHHDRMMPPVAGLIAAEDHQGQQRQHSKHNHFLHRSPSFRAGMPTTCGSVAAAVAWLLQPACGTVPSAAGSAAVGCTRHRPGCPAFHGLSGSSCRRCGPCCSACVLCCR